MKIKSAHDARNHFGEFIDAADNVLPELLLDKDPGYDGWLVEKVSATIRRVEAGETELFEHDDAMKRLRERVKARAGEMHSPPAIKTDR